MSKTWSIIFFSFYVFVPLIIIYIDFIKCIYLHYF